MRDFTELHAQRTGCGRCLEHDLRFVMGTGFDGHRTQRAGVDDSVDLRFFDRAHPQFQQVDARVAFRSALFGRVHDRVEVDTVRVVTDFGADCCSHGHTLLGMSCVCGMRVDTRATRVVLEMSLLAGRQQIFHATCTNL